MHSLGPRQTLHMSFNTMPRHTTLGSQKCRTCSICNSSLVILPSNTWTLQYHPNRPLSGPHLQGCRYLRHSLQSLWSLMIMTVMMKMCHLQGCPHNTPRSRHHTHNLQHHHQLTTCATESAPLPTKQCYTSCPHITMASQPHKLHDNVIQQTCSTPYSTTRLGS